MISESGDQPGYGFIHVFHQPGIMQVGKLRTEILFGFIKIIDPPLHQYPAEGTVDPERILQGGNLVMIRN
jgi:hypothetical protein